MNEFEKAEAAIKEAMLQEPFIYEGMPFYLVVGTALETALEILRTEKGRRQSENREE